MRPTVRFILLTLLFLLGSTECFPITMRRLGMAINEVTATYEGNRLTRLSVESDAAVFATRVGMRTVGDFTLGYDHAGRLVADGSRGISCIDYDHQGYPTRVAFDTGEEYTQSHDSEGRLMGSVTRMLSSAGRTVTKTHTYTGGGHVLRNDTLEMTRFDGGYFDADGKARYYVTDFRGNNTCVIDGAGTRVHAASYYPYGEPHGEDAWTTGTAGGLRGNRFMFAGNERVTDLGANMYDFNARMYVASFPRFTRMDPLCEKYPWLNPYAYCAGDPINLTDPTGLTPNPYEASLMSGYVYRDSDVMDKQYNNIYEADLNSCNWYVWKEHDGRFPSNTASGKAWLQTAIFKRESKGHTEVAFAFAGTNSVLDALDDFLQLLGVSPQYHKGLNVAKEFVKIMEEQNITDITFVGHSLGGGEAILSSKATGYPAMTFNPAAVSQHTYRFHNAYKSSHIENYVSTYNINGFSFVADPLTIWQTNHMLFTPGKTKPVFVDKPVTHSIKDIIEGLRPSK